MMSQSLIAVYINGGLASTITIGLTLVCVVIISPALSLAYAENILSFLIALAVGCLTGDAVFHLLPHVFLAQESLSTGEVTNTTSQSPNAHDAVVVFQALPIAGTIFIFYFIYAFSHCKGTADHSHSHFKIRRKESVSLQEDGEIYNELINPSTCEDSTSAAKLNTIEAKQEPTSRLDGVPVVIWMIVIGDVVHSFSDGVAIGGAYAKSFYGGLGTTVAIVCHEVPHGVGDFAMMVSAGLGRRTSFCLLCIALSPMYLGMLVGSTLSQLMDLSKVIFAITAGMFLFISLVGMLPGILVKMKETEEDKLKLLLLHSCGILLGMLTMLVIAVMEGKLNR